MRNKKAQIFILWLVFITLLFCGIAIYFNSLQELKINSSLAPVGNIALIEVNNKLFETQEKNIIIISAKESGIGSEFGTFEIDYFKERFFKHIFDSNDFKNYLSKDILINGRTPESLDEKSFIRAIYNISFEQGILKVSRSPIEKSFVLKTSEMDKINFPVRINYKYSEEYLIKKDELYGL